ncbi:DUF6314 family protein [Rickettsia endosymbiont of Halotydeus destructor]|uniref:DUF6314 family protein n=1 Tax=Rickettsia endosymbiont of Halotydeus destructor TaxID=2996754 RepID=UPI003BB0F0CD
MKAAISETTKEIFFRLEGKYFIKRVVGNHGTGEGIAYFLKAGANNLLYKEELEINYNNIAGKISAVKEYRYAFGDNKIIKYFNSKENSNLFYQLNFIESLPLKALGTYLCNRDRYEATYTFLNSNSFILNYQILGPEKDYNIITDFKRIT